MKENLSSKIFESVKENEELNNLFDDDEKNIIKQEKLTESLIELSILDVAIELTILDMSSIKIKNR